MTSVPHCKSIEWFLYDGCKLTDWFLYDGKHWLLMVLKSSTKLALCETERELQSGSDLPKELL